MGSNCCSNELEHSKQSLFRNEQPLNTSKVQSEVVMEKPQICELNSSNIDGKLFTEKRSIITKHQYESKLIQSEQEVSLSEQLSNKTSLTNLYAWGCTDLILEEYRRKGISQMFEWQAECLLLIAQVSKSIE